MKNVPYEDLRDMLASFKREALHLEMRDTYGTETEIPHLRKWLAGEPDDPSWLEPWFDKVRAGTAAGKSFKRARIVSEPVTDYQRWVLKDAHLFVDAGEDIRWIPRRLVSTIALPGNDFWLFDDETVVFLIFSGNGLVIDRLVTSYPDTIRLCRAAFDAVWQLSIPDSEYKPD